MQAHETCKFAQHVDSAAEQMHYESKREREKGKTIQKQIEIKFGKSNWVSSLAIQIAQGRGRTRENSAW